MSSLKKMLPPLCFLAVIYFPIAYAAPIAGDIDMSGKGDAVDVQLSINCALGISASEFADINYDGTDNIVDVQLAINAVLGINIDADGDGLCDAGEANLGTDPNDSDTDHDGWSDSD